MTTNAMQNVDTDLAPQDTPTLANEPSGTTGTTFEIGNMPVSSTVPQDVEAPRAESEAAESVFVDTVADRADAGESNPGAHAEQVREATRQSARRKLNILMNDVGCYMETYCSLAVTDAFSKVLQGELDVDFGQQKNVTHKTLLRHCMAPNVTLYPFDPAEYSEFAALLQPDGGINISDIVSASKKHKTVDEETWNSHKKKFLPVLQVLWAKGIVPMQMKIDEAASLCGHGGPKKNKKWGELMETRSQKVTIVDILHQLHAILDDELEERMEQLHAAKN